VFLFLLNSSGAIILFVYLLIAISQVVLRRRTPPERLLVRMWFFPVLSLLTIAVMVAVLVQMGITEDTRSQLVLSLVSFAVMLALYWLTRRAGGSISAEEMDSTAPTTPATRVLVLANETVTAPELLAELRRIDADGRAEYFVCVPANPVDTGQAEKTGAAFVWRATVEAAQRRLDDTLAALESHGLHAEGELGDYRPLTALSAAAERFRPDRIVISTHRPEHSAWLGQDLITRARAQFDVPVTHIVAHSAVQA
jgi:GABA permease